MTWGAPPCNRTDQIPCIDILTHAMENHTQSKVGHFLSIKAVCMDVKITSQLEERRIINVTKICTKQCTQDPRCYFAPGRDSLEWPAYLFRRCDGRH
jgi:hypothetical protein